MALLNRQQFLSADDKRYKIIELPDLGGEVKIRSMSGEDELEFEKFKVDKVTSEWVFWAICRYCVDENNSPMFTEQDLEDIKKKSSASLKKIFEAILDLNIINDEKIREEAKNL